MQIVPVLLACRLVKNGNTHPAQFTRSKNNNIQSRPYHKYTGNVSADLAWASMFDNKIAQELKLLGLI